MPFITFLNNKSYFSLQRLSKHLKHIEKPAAVVHINQSCTNCPLSRFEDLCVDSHVIVMMKKSDPTATNVEKNCFASLEIKAK